MRLLTQPEVSMISRSIGRPARRDRSSTAAVRSFRTVQQTQPFVISINGWLSASANSAAANNAERNLRDKPRELERVAAFGVSCGAMRVMGEAIIGLGGRGRMRIRCRGSAGLVRSASLVSGFPIANARPLPFTKLSWHAKLACEDAFHLRAPRETEEWR
jgi:hypothetical protein